MSDTRLPAFTAREEHLMDEFRSFFEKELLDVFGVVDLWSMALGFFAAKGSTIENSADMAEELKRRGLI